MGIFGLLVSMICWQLFKAQPESPQKRRRYMLATNFARRR